MRIYLDSELVDHVVQANVPISGRITPRIFRAGVTTVVSDLTRIECMVVALRSGVTQLRRDFETFFAPSEVLTLTTPVLDRAAEIRATHGFTVVDAIHLAAATLHGSDEFLTRRRRLKRYTGVRVEVV
jgi:uncharacterized protein